MYVLSMPASPLAFFFQGLFTRPMNKRSILPISGIVLLLIVGVYSWLQFSGKPLEIKESKISAPAGPVFTQEGTLYFFDKASRDTLTNLTIEIADNETDITQGLMWRHTMADSCGMLFLFAGEEPRSFWMKNTYLPLDIIFINNYQQIVSIARNTEPLTLTSIPSAAPARYVVEVNAGYCLTHGITEGDFMEFEVQPSK